ncbi:NADH-quinone oxidoreductase subunit J [candidate division KSB1 bacterium]
MNLETIGFYALTLLLTFAAVMVITFKRAIHSALALVVALISVAGLFALLSSGFLAVLQVIIYAGAVMVLFMFVIMIIGPARVRGLSLNLPGLFVALLVGMFFFLDIAYLAWTFIGTPGTDTAPAAYGGLEEIAGLLFTEYLLPFELTSLVMIVAIVGVVVLAKRIERD